MEFLSRISVFMPYTHNIYYNAIITMRKLQVRCILIKLPRWIEVLPTNLFWEPPALIMNYTTKTCVRKLWTNSDRSWQWPDQNLISYFGESSVSICFPDSLISFRDHVADSCKCNSQPLCAEASGKIFVSLIKQDWCIQHIFILLSLSFLFLKCW